MTKETGFFTLEAGYNLCISYKKPVSPAPCLSFVGLEIVAGDAPAEYLLQNVRSRTRTHHRPSTFIYTEKFKIFDRNDRPRPDFRIELLSSVSFH
jgi:hypothetical protein